MCLKFFLIFFLYVLISVGQENFVKYDKTYVFNDGIYLTFDEFRQNKPSITDFKAVRKQFSGKISLEYQCFDEKTNTLKTCVVTKCWGYVHNNNVYISQGISGHFYKLHIIGALLHYYAFVSVWVPYDDYYYGYPYSYRFPTTRFGRRTESREFILEFSTGKRYDFNYRSFSSFLLERDKELYEELQKTKRKRKMIYHFMLKYNERHTIYFPQ